MRKIQEKKLSLGIKLAYFEIDRLMESYYGGCVS